MATMKRVILYVLVTAALIVLISSGIAAYNSLIGITTYKGPEKTAADVEPCAAQDWQESRVGLINRPYP